jgi:succinoglycan biosynthesis protein ExoA
MLGTGAAQGPRETDDAGAGPASVDVSVLVPVRNEAAGIRTTVAAMQAQRFDGRLEFLFIDGRSDDATRAIVKGLASDDARIRILDNPDREVTPALNIGLRAARGRYIARMDAHALYPPDYLAVGARRLEARDVEWVSGPALPEGTNTWSRRIELALRSPLGVGGSPFRRALSEEIETDGAFTGMWRRETLDRHHGWDEDWIVNEDGELAARIRQGGGRIVCLPQMASRYFPRRSLRALARQYWRYGQYRAKTAGRYPESIRRSHLVPPAVTAVVAVSVVCLNRRRRAPQMVLAAYAAALCLEAVRLAPRARPRSDAAFLPVVLGTMHLAWGGGFLLGSVRFGAPLRAVACALGPYGRSARTRPPTRPLGPDDGAIRGEA